MRAKMIKFERGIDPKKAMDTGYANRFIPPQDINFVNGESNDFGRGMGNGNPKITIIINGETTKAGRAFLRGDGSTPGTNAVNDLIIEFLNLPETKDKISQIFEGTKTSWYWKKKRKNQ